MLLANHSFKVFVIIVALSFLSNFTALAQGEIFDQREVFFRDEQTWAVSAHSTGYGINYKYAKRINGYNWRTYDFDFMEIKDPKEYTTSLLVTGSRFVYGKMNSLYITKLSMGKQREVFSKYDEGGISIHFYYNAGAVLALKKPMYYMFITGQDTTERKRFNADVHSIYDIYDKASFFYKLTETILLPGLSARAGFTFDYATDRMKVRAVETGVMFDVFPKQIELLATPKHHFFFTSLYLTYRFGRVVDKSHIQTE